MMNLFGRYQERPVFSKPRTRPLEVIMVGLSRTGTTSMSSAMTKLGYGPVWNSPTMSVRHQLAFCCDILRTKLTGVGPPPDFERFESLFGEHVCVAGEFAACMAEELVEAYPDAKIILTVRNDDEEGWLRSLLQSLWYQRTTWIAAFLRNVDGMWAAHDAVMEPYWRILYGGDPATHGLRVYREHAARVKRVVQPSERLLVFDTKEGWGPLCAFLGKDVPEEEFPHLNPWQAHQRRVNIGQARALRRWLAKAAMQGTVVAGIVGLAWLCQARLASFRIGSVTGRV